MLKSRIVRGNTHQRSTNTNWPHDLDRVTHADVSDLACSVILGITVGTDHHKAISVVITEPGIEESAGGEVDIEGKSKPRALWSTKVGVCTVLHGELLPFLKVPSTS